MDSFKCFSRFHDEKLTYCVNICSYDYALPYIIRSSVKLPDSGIIITTSFTLKNIISDKGIFFKVEIDASEDMIYGEDFYD
jgi:hypothetical protein